MQSYCHMRKADPSSEKTANEGMDASVGRNVPRWVLARPGKRCCAPWSSRIEIGSSMWKTTLVLNLASRVDHAVEYLVCGSDAASVLA